MKKTLLFLSAIITGSMAFAQTPVTIPNAGFEDWDASGLDQWSDTITSVTNYTITGLTSGTLPITYKTADSVIVNPYDGVKAVAITSYTYNTGSGTAKLPGAIVSGDNASFKITANVVGTSPTNLTAVGTPTVEMQGKIPFGSGKKVPTGLKGYYRYASDSAITGSMSVLLFANGGDTVGIYFNSAATNTLNSASKVMAKTSTWAAFSFNFSVNPLSGLSSIPSTIDSARIIGLSCMPSDLVANKSSAHDTLFLDKLEFLYYTPPAGIESADDSGFGVSQNSPNPTSGSTVIEVVTPNAGTLTFSVVDILGTVVNEQTIAAVAGSNTITYDGSATPSGTYFYTVSNGSSSVTKKLVIAK